jgi:hypothetical protein
MRTEPTQKITKSLSATKVGGKLQYDGRAGGLHKTKEEKNGGQRGENRSLSTFQGIRDMYSEGNEGRSGDRLSFAGLSGFD